MGNFTVPNPNGPPPKFPLSALNPGPETPEDWDAMIRWLLLFWQNITQVTQQLQTQQVLPPPNPLPFPVLRPAPRYVTFVFDNLIAVGSQTSNCKIQLPAETTPLLADLSAVFPPQSSAALFDIQTSPDLVHWTSILTAPLALPKNALQIVTSNIFAPGAKLTPGNWIRSIIAAGSDLTARQALLQLMVD